MADDDEGDSRITPRSTLSAQDILTLSPSHYGFLRYEGGLEQFVDRYYILKPIFREAAKWRLRYAVLYEGCMYLYPDELSRNPLKAFSLADYESVNRIPNTEPNDRKQRFMLVPSESEGAKIMKFFTTSDTERKVWFQKIRKEMEFAITGNSQIRSEPDIDEYISLEKPIVKMPPRPRPQPAATTQMTPAKPLPAATTQKTPAKPLPPPPGADSDDDCSDYDTIQEDALPELKSPIKPHVAPKPQKKNRFSRTEFEFNSSDRSRVEGILEDKDIGTFLVRKSRQDEQEVLSIKTTEGVKEYKIYHKVNGFSIDNKLKWFPTTEDLLDFYTENDVPNRGMTLTRAYSSPEDGEHL